MAALDLLGIESTSFSNSVEVITRNHELTIASISLVLLLGRRSLLHHQPLQSRPQILNRVEIWTVSRPSKQLDIVLLKPAGTDTSCMAWCSILLKYEVTSSTEQITCRGQHFRF